MKTTPVYLSRAFVEFGPFSIDEMKNFYSRGLLQEIDHIRPEGSDHWLHLMDWINSQPATETPSPKTPAKKAAPAAKKVAPATKKPTAPTKKAAPAPAPAKKAAAKTPKPKA